eukprot:TRINITY_DN2874_c8_g1_i1.p1 TRINITY_DN2874_c8_g1~~TRINITY_DN2874_c8_g1_i1.p1  ORF type:complete len:279 (+),score=92.12 TRINITY_DN2874_c8_g1_i1:56-892(+)
MEMPKWKRDAEVKCCEGCEAAFTLFNRRHHCRMCGCIFCNKCTAERRALPPHVGLDGPQRVCRECRVRLDQAKTVTPLPSQPPSQSGSPPADSHRAAQPAARADSGITKQRKICVLGAAYVGKSAVCIKYVEDRFSPYYHPTINHTYQRTTSFKGEKYMMTIMDTAGQDECSLFLPQYSIGTHGYVILFSLTDPQSFDLVSSIYDNIQDCNVLDGVPLILAGNKADLVDERKVREEDARELAAKWGVPYIECSAKESQGIDELFENVLAEVLRADEIH